MSASKEATILFQPSWMSVESYSLFLLLINAFLYAVMGLFLKLCSNRGIPSTELVLARAVIQSFFVGVLLWYMRPVSVAQGGAHYDYVVDHNDRLRTQAHAETGTHTDDETRSLKADERIPLPQRPLLFTPFGGTWEVQKLVIVRGMVGGVGFIMYFATMKLLPLGDALTFLALSPVVTILLAAIFLRESILCTHILAIVFSLAGATCIARPTFIFGVDETDTIVPDSPYHWVGYITAILGSCSAAVALTLVRKAGRLGVHTMHLLCSFIIFSFIIAFAFGHMQWVQRIDGIWYLPSIRQHPETWIYLIVMGVMGTGSHFLMNFAGRLAPAGLGSIMCSSDIMWAYLFQIAVFNQTPRLVTWVGVAFIFVSLVIIAFQKFQDEQEQRVTEGGSEQEGLLDDDVGAHGDDNGENDGDEEDAASRTMQSVQYGSTS